MSITAAQASALDNMCPSAKDTGVGTELKRIGDLVTAMSVAELGVIDGAVAGTQAAGKAVVADTNVNIGATKVTALHIGTSGSETQVTATGAELNTLDLSVVGAVKKYQVATITRVANTSPQDTTIVLPAKAVITDVFLSITAAEATGTTKTIDVGIKSGDEDGLLDGVDVSGTGVKKGTLLSSGQTRGALLRADESGAGVLVPEVDVTSGGATVVYTLGSNNFAELAGKIIVEYIEIA
jgi:hypothetical protein